MNLILRMIRVVLVACFRRRIDLLDESRVRFIVWPNDLDLNIHMNNGRYLSIMDLGRFDLIVRSGLFRTILKNRWSPVAGAVAIRYRASLKPFQRYELISRLVCWDDKWTYIEQRFERRGRVIAVAYVKALFRDKGGSLPSKALLDAIGLSRPSPAMPPAAAAIANIEDLARS